MAVDRGGKEPAGGKGQDVGDLDAGKMAAQAEAAAQAAAEAQAKSLQQQIQKQLDTLMSAPSVAADTVPE